METNLGRPEIARRGRMKTPPNLQRADSTNFIPAKTHEINYTVCDFRILEVGKG